MVNTGIYFIKSVPAEKWLNKSRCAGSDRGARVQIWDSCSISSQWFVCRVCEDVYTLQNVHGGTWLHKKGKDGHGNGAGVHMWDDRSHLNAQWCIRRCADGTYTIRSMSTGKFLNKRGRDGKQNGGVVHTWGENASNRDNRWLFEPVSSPVRVNPMARARCQILLVPSLPDQRFLETLGVITQKNYNGANWGGVHVTVGYRLRYTEARHGQLRAAADACKGINMMLAQFTRPRRVRNLFCFAVRSPQAIGKLRDAANHAKRAGWEASVRTHWFHCTTFVRPTGRGNRDQIGKRLQQAHWGWVLAIQTSSDQYSIDWSSFRPV